MITEHPLEEGSFLINEAVDFLKRMLRSPQEDASQPSRGRFAALKRTLRGRHPL